MCGDTACGSHTEGGDTFGQDEGIDQGGLRRAWFELAATNFIRSDLSMHAVQDASHLDSERKLSGGTQIPGKGYGLPAKGHPLKSNLCGPCQTKFHCFLDPFRAWCAYFSCPGWRPVGMAISVHTEVLTSEVYKLNPSWMTLRKTLWV